MYVYCNFYISRLKLIGQTVISSTKDHRVRTIVIAPESRQIKVQKGDFIGFFLPKGNKAGITYDKCDNDVSAEYYGHQYSASAKKISDWEPGITYTFAKEKVGCKKISLTVNVL